MPKISNPQSHFIVIAGPNGAGKSLTSQNILQPYGIKAFDWDKEFDLKWQRFDYDPAVSEGVREAVNLDFSTHIESAFNEKRSVSYETNFHSTHDFELAKEARSNGYYNILYFLAVANPELAIDRVKLRVSKGGHNVGEIIVRERFKNGLKHLDYSLEFFDSIFIYNSSVTFQLQLIIQDQKLIYKSNHIDEIIMQQLPKLQSFL